MPASWPSQSEIKQMNQLLLAIVMVAALSHGPIGELATQAWTTFYGPGPAYRSEKRLNRSKLYNSDQSCGNLMWVTEQADTPLAKRELFESKIIGRSVSYHIMLPQSYSLKTDKKYPLMIWLHGSGPSTKGIGQISNIYNRLMQSGRIPEMILVFPNGLTNSMWADSKNGCTPVESIVIKELIPHINKTFRTTNRRESTIVEGHSMGGYGSLRFGFKYPQLFGSVSAISPGPLQESLFSGSKEYIANAKVREQVFQKVYGSSESYFKEISPLELAKTYAKSKAKVSFKLRIITGTEDEGYDATVQFHDNLVKEGISREFITLPGVGHAPAATLRVLQQKNGGREWLQFYKNAGG